MSENLLVRNVLTRTSNGLKETLKDHKNELFDLVSGYEDLEFFIANEIEEFATIWTNLVECMLRILNFLNQRKIVLRFLTKSETVGVWYSKKPDLEDKTVMHLFFKYLVSDFVSEVPDNEDGQEFNRYHRHAIVYFKKLIDIIKHFETSN